MNDASPAEPFGPCRARLEMLVGYLEGEGAAAASHAELEKRVSLDGREVLRLALQGHLDLRAESEVRIEEVKDSTGMARASVEAGHERVLATVFGEVTVARLAFRRRSCPNLHPADASLNLPAERYSHGLRELAAIEAARGSFDGVVEAIGRASGQHLGKRQVEELAARAAVDFEAFYAQARRPEAEPTDVVVLSADGKGIVMRPGALRPATAKAAATAVPKLATRLSKGEKANRKRMATVGAVYDLTPIPRAPADILARGGGTSAPPAPAPVAKGKWLMASVENDAATVVAQVFDEAERRDPDHRRPWVALVDGNNHQIDRVKAEAKDREVEVTVIVDLVHVLEYLWGAAWCFFAEGDAGAEAWVGDKALAVLNGQASTVAASIRRKATCRRLDPGKRAKADTCADYLLRKRPYLDYPSALAEGGQSPPASSKGACRHLVKDRMDVTGARWSVAGAEAVLKLRALRANDDFPAYWQFHLSQEEQRVHHARYADNVIPTAA
ncbi:MAG: ISKra4 family transposase [Actinomycetota bacterium]|nr:ISKra4 family transposase [Actinomycetota bacterium]